LADLSVLPVGQEDGRVTVAIMDGVKLKMPDPIIAATA
jgi:hypothetical protein